MFFNRFICSALCLSAASFGCFAQSTEVKGGQGHLEFSERKGDVFEALSYKSSDGNELDIFDSGLGFYYRPEKDKYLSPDKKYFFVNFVAYGEEGEGGGMTESDENMCAFVRMKDGCVVQVDPGNSAICGGEWNHDNEWVSAGHVIRNLDLNQTTAERVLSDYSRGMSRGSSRGNTVQDYLMNGTAFGNVLACDPIKKDNSKYYEGLLKALTLDGDKVHVKQVREKLDSLK